MKRTKLIAGLLSCMMCLVMLTIGVWAVASVATLDINGNLKFYPEGLFVQLSGEVYRGNSSTESEMTKLSAPRFTYGPVANFDNTQDELSGNFPLEAWEIGNIAFIPNQRFIKIKVYITNYSDFAITGTPTVTIGGQDISETITGLNVTSNTSELESITSNTTATYELVLEATGSTEFSKSLNVSFEFEEYVPLYTIEQENIGGVDYTFVYFGRYPQTYVGDAMNATLETWYTGQPVAETYTAYKGRTSSSPFELRDPVVYNAYEYIDGNTYCRVPQAVSENISGGVRTFNDGTTIVSGETYWFKVEPIQWRVLTENYTDTENTTPVSYLLSEYCLTANTTFNPSTSNTNHTHYSAETNAIRPFLNEVFYEDAFTEEEKIFIAKKVLTDLDMDATDSWSNDPNLTINSTSPLNVFAPSYYDMINTDYGFNSSYSNSDQKRRASATDFAMANRAYKSSNTDKQDIHGIGATKYWTSSARSTSSDVYLVSTNGAVSFTYVGTEYYAVRPALLFNL